MESESTKLIHSYITLSWRKFQVHVEEHYSKPQDVTTGSLEGSKLSPLLFLIMSDHQLATEAKIVMYADDVTAIVTGKDTKDLERKQGALAEQMAFYMEGANLVLNPKKTALLVFGTKQNKFLCCRGQLIHQTDCHDLLGIKVSEGGGWSNLCQYVRSELEKRAGVFLRLRNQVPQ